MATVFEVPTGAIDGANTSFVASQPYVAGSLHYFLNGQLKRSDLDDGVIETDPSTGAFNVKEAPLTNDVVQVYYLSSAGAGGDEIGIPKFVVAAISPQESISTRLSVEKLVQAVLRDSPMRAAMTKDRLVQGALGPDTGISGGVVVCDV